MYCPKCGTQNDDNNFHCTACNEVIQIVPPPVTDIADDPAMRLLLPVGQSGLAIAAGYVGLFSLLLVPAPFAILLGILALRDIKKNPKKHGKGRAIFAIIMGSLCSFGLISFIISIIAAKSVQ